MWWFCRKLAPFGFLLFHAHTLCVRVFLILKTSTYFLCFCLGNGITHWYDYSAEKQGSSPVFPVFPRSVGKLWMWMGTKALWGRARSRDEAVYQKVQWSWGEVGEQRGLVLNGPLLFRMTCRRWGLACPDGGSEGLATRVFSITGKSEQQWRVRRGNAAEGGEGLAHCHCRAPGHEAGVAGKWAFQAVFLIVLAVGAGQRSQVVVQALPVRSDVF